LILVSTTHSKCSVKIQYVTVLGVAAFCHMRSDVISQQMAIKFGTLMQDIRLIPKINKKSFWKKFEFLCFGFRANTSVNER